MPNRPSSPINRAALVLALSALLAVACSWNARAQSDEVPLQVVTANAHDVELKDLGSGVWEVKTTGNDPYIYLKTDGRPIDVTAHPILTFDYFSTTGMGRMLLFVGQVLDLGHLVTGDQLGVSEGWSTPAIDMGTTTQAAAAPVTQLRLTLGDHAGGIAQVRNFRARPPTAHEKMLEDGRVTRLQEDKDLTARLTAYFTQSFPDTIASVTATRDHVRIRGKVAIGTGPVFLAEVPMWKDITRLDSLDDVQPILPRRNGVFSVSVPRDPENRSDPLLSGWAIVSRNGSGYQAVSQLRYADSETPRANLSPARMKTRKGLGGCPFDHPDMKELGVGSATMNLILTDFMVAEPGPNRVPYRYAGKTWYVDMGVIGGYDLNILSAAKHRWEVSGIVLIRPAGNAPVTSWIAQAGYPYAESVGIYVLPNFTSEDGTDAYAAAINFLAERYSRPDGKYGRVHDWIMHNEINAGFFWSNAGQKTEVTYMDLYQKSMRVAYLLARQYDPNAKPLISLEHGWNFKADTRAYTARALLQQLVNFSHTEGDFEWGIAYHPYAQDITNPRTWDDADATFSFDTKYVTFKNLEVLNAWAGLPQARYHGRPREIQLTEQGLNSPDYSEKSLTEQAAGVAYAWQKIQPLKNITAFQYHLWMDDAGEGGLRLGLRKFSTETTDHQSCKPSWYVWQAAGTPKWHAVADPYLKVIGIQDWSQVNHTGPIK